MHERPFLFPTLHVRKTGKWHREAWKACWQFPDVTRPELKLHERPFLFPTLHVRKQEAAKTEKGGGERGTEAAKQGWETAKQGPEGPRRPLEGMWG